MALRGSDIGSRAGGHGGRVYSKQQEDLKLPEEVKTEEIRRGGVGDHLQLIGDKTTSGLVELGKITKVYGDDYALDEAVRAREDRGARAPQGHVGGTVEAEEAPPDLPPTPRRATTGPDGAPLAPPSRPPAPPTASRASPAIRPVPSRVLYGSRQACRHAARLVPLRVVEARPRAGLL